MTIKWPQFRVVLSADLSLKGRSLLSNIGSKYTIRKVYIITINNIKISNVTSVTRSFQATVSPGTEATVNQNLIRNSQRNISVCSVTSAWTYSLPWQGTSKRSTSYLLHTSVITSLTLKEIFAVIMSRMTRETWTDISNLFILLSSTTVTHVRRSLPARRSWRLEKHKRNAWDLNQLIMLKFLNSTLSIFSFRRLPFRYFTRFDILMCH